MGCITFVLISACDVDGDGREEIYFLNTNTYSGASDTGELDKLFRFNDETGKFEDILTKDYNIGVLENLAGRSVACIDRKGNRLEISTRILGLKNSEQKKQMALELFKNSAIVCFIDDKGIRQSWLLL